jgi:hypothetical protein
MSYIFLMEGEMSKNVTNAFKQVFNQKVNPEIAKSKLSGVKKLKAETISPEEMFDVKSFHDDIDETTSTGSVGGSYVAPLFGKPIKKSSLFAPKGTPEHDEGKKILKRMEKPVGKVFTKKDLKESFLEEEEDLDETTTTGGVGGVYVGPAMWAKNKSNWRGTKKQYPGGKFVKAKEKCKTFPYCDEGPGAIELSNTPKDKIDNVFNENKSLYDMTDDEIWDKRDSDYIKLIEIISSINKLEQFPAIKRLWDLFQDKFEGYISKYLKNNVEKIIKEKYDELVGEGVNGEMVAEGEESKNEEEKNKDYEKVIKTLKSVQNSKQFNTGLKMMINLRVKYNDDFTEEQLDVLKNIIHDKIEDIKKGKKNVEENKSVHRKIND